MSCDATAFIRISSICGHKQKSITRSTSSPTKFEINWYLNRAVKFHARHSYDSYQSIVSNFESTSFPRYFDSVNVCIWILMNGINQLSRLRSVSVFIFTRSTSNSQKIKRNWMKCEMERILCALCFLVYQEIGAEMPFRLHQKSNIVDDKSEDVAPPYLLYLRSMDRHDFVVSGSKSSKYGFSFRRIVWMCVKCKCYLYCHPDASGLILVFMIAHQCFYSSIWCHRMFSL